MTTLVFKRLPWIALAGVLIALACWPAYVARNVEAAHASSLPTAAPVTADYLTRDKLVAFWEGQTARRIHGDMLSPRQLSDQYLQRYRERGNIDDVVRAEAAAKRSLAAQPRGNMPAELSLASVDLTLHRFKAALAITRHVESYDTGDDAMWTREASLDLEIGDYAGAERKLDAVRAGARDDAWRVVESRYLELTGRLDAARELLATAAAFQNGVYEAPAQQRAWYFFRQGEMAFEAGDDAAALDFENRALAIFPSYADANRLKAKFACAVHDWTTCLAAATASANVVPYPETLGYQVDAERGLGDPGAAARTDDLIRAVERVGNAQHISDRLLAIYYAEHRERPHDAFAIATRELATRDDIFTEDTLAWAAAMDGRWDTARVASRKALRFDTPISLLQYHAGMIAAHFGDREEARRRLTRALALNAQFHPFYADDARAQLATL